MVAEGVSFDIKPGEGQQSTTAREKGSKGGVCVLEGWREGRHFAAPSLLAATLRPEQVLVGA